MSQSHPSNLARSAFFRTVLNVEETSLGFIGILNSIQKCCIIVKDFFCNNYLINTYTSKFAISSAVQLGSIAFLRTGDGYLGGDCPLFIFKGEVIRSGVRGKSSFLLLPPPLAPLPLGLGGVVRGEKRDFLLVPDLGGVHGDDGKNIVSSSSIGSRRAAAGGGEI
jgi:hypothetical protein